MAEKLAISFILPVLNETDSLRISVDSILRLAAGHVKEILIVVADRSTPESLAVVRQLQQSLPTVIHIHQQTLPRLGGALREAFDVASGTHLMLMASDLETDPEAIPQFIGKMLEGHWDIVAGSRWLAGGGFEGYGRVRSALNWLFQQSFRIWYGTRLTDLTFAYRLYRRDVLAGIAWRELGHPLLLECLLKPLRLGARVVEVPCRWRRRYEGCSAGSYRQMFQYVPLAFRVRLTPRSRIGSIRPIHGE